MGKTELMNENTVRNQGILLPPSSQVPGPYLANKSAKLKTNIINLSISYKPVGTNY